MNIKNNKGITIADITISIGIIFLFSSLIAGLVYNYSLSTKSIQRKADATYQAVNIIEELKNIEYNNICDILDTKTKAENQTYYELSLSDFTSYFNIEMYDGYLATIQLQKYQDVEENVEDIIIIATVNVKYKVGTQDQSVELQTLLVGGMS